MKCKKHPKYKAKLPPRGYAHGEHCLACGRIWETIMSKKQICNKKKSLKKLLLLDKICSIENEIAIVTDMWNNFHAKSKNNKLGWSDLREEASKYRHSINKS